VIVEGGVPRGGNRRGQLEMYDRDRYFTVTGDHVAGTPRTVKDRTQELRGLHEKYIADTDTDDDPLSVPSEVRMSDDELIEKAMNAANGEKFRALWQGDTSDYPSHSEADQALCNMLAFWTGGDKQRIERLFNQSGLVRDKWRDREDYRDCTTQNAIQDCSSYYKE
jgi:primase-polymerase (primpol)-like protein